MPENNIDIDLTQQKKAEKDLAKNEANLKAIIENAFESIWAMVRWLPPDFLEVI